MAKFHDLLHDKKVRRDWLIDAFCKGNYDIDDTYDYLTRIENSTIPRGTQSFKMWLMPFITTEYNNENEEYRRAVQKILGLNHRMEEYRQFVCGVLLRVNYETTMISTVVYSAIRHGLYEFAWSIIECCPSNVEVDVDMLYWPFSDRNLDPNVCRNLLRYLNAIDQVTTDESLRSVIKIFGYNMRPEILDICVEFHTDIVHCRMWIDHFHYAAHRGFIDSMCWIYENIDKRDEFKQAIGLVD